MVARLCTEAVKLKVPMAIDLKFGRNWGDAKHTWNELVEGKETKNFDVPVPEPIFTPPREVLPCKAPPMAAAAAKQGYCHGESGETAMDFDFTADLAGFTNITSDTSSGGGATSTGARTNAGAAPGAGGQARTAYVHRTASGAPHMKVVRTPAKTFPTFRWTGHDWTKGWPTMIVPYRLPELLKAAPEEPVLIAEGEKDVDNLTKLHFVATTNPGGAGKWTPECARYLQGKQVAVVLQDNDAAGAKHVAKVRATLRDIVPTVITLSFADEVEEHGDVSDWLKSGGTAEALRTRIRLALKRNADVELTVVQLHQVELEAIDWLWEGHLIRGSLEIMSGRPGIGKTQVHCQILACISTGCDWPDGSPGPKPRNVILLSAEDSVKEYRRRLTAADADLSRIIMITAVRRDQKTGQAFLLAEDLDKLERQLDRSGDVGLIAIDPITAFMGTSNRVDTHRASDVAQSSLRLCSWPSARIFPSAWSRIR